MSSFSSCTIKNLTELLDPSDESRLASTHHLLSIGGGASCVINARHTLVQLVQFGGDASGGRDGAGGIGRGGQAVGQKSAGRLVALGRQRGREGPSTSVSRPCTACSGRLLHARL